MGVAVGGIALRASVDTDVPGLLRRIFERPVDELDAPPGNYFDARIDGNVVVERYGDSLFIYNADLAFSILDHVDADITPLHERLGKPDLIVAFGCFDSGGSHGYVLIEEGQRTRTRFETIGAVDHPVILEQGTPKMFEAEWLNAAFYREEDDCPEEEWQKIYFLPDRPEQVPEYGLSRFLTGLALEKLFSVCPWETEEKAVYRFFRLGAVVVRDERSLWGRVKRAVGLG